MAHKPMFSRRFLTILIVVTSIAIVLLSRIQPQDQPTESEPPTDEASTATTTTTDTIKSDTQHDQP